MPLHILDRLSIGIILLDSVGRIVFANTAARVLLRNGQRLGPRTSIFESLPPAASRRLGEEIGEAQRGSTSAMTIASAVDRSSVMLLMAKLHSSETAQLGRGFQEAVSVLFLCDPTRPVELPVAWMMGAYGLTLAEARTALSASSGMTVAGMAEQLEVSPNTIKTHLRRVFAKTGTGRQAELTRLVALLSLVRDPLVTGASS